MKEVFISYKSNNKELGNNDGTVAKELCKAIEAAGISCWMAPDSIPDGEEYADHITDAIENCVIQIVVFSQFTMLSQYVPDEVRLARDSKKCIISFKIDDTSFEKKWKFYLGGKQWFDAQGDYHKKIPELISTLRVKLGKSGPFSTSPEVAVPSKLHSDSLALTDWPSSEEIEIEPEILPEEDKKGSFSWNDSISLKGGITGATGGYFTGGPVGGIFGAVGGAIAQLVSKESEKESSIERFSINGVSFNMVEVEGGTFKRAEGSKVLLSTFHIGETQVTQKLWQAVMDENPSYFKGDLARPVECVSWYDCQEFIRRLNQMTGRCFRLPTEAEWEFAARGGNMSKGYKYAGSNNSNDVAWCRHWGTDSKTYPVGTKKPNELGIFDMSGNVSEWCQDWYIPFVYKKDVQINPVGPKSGKERVHRGGTWNSSEMYCSVEYRWKDDPSIKFDGLGLRLAL